MKEHQLAIIDFFKDLKPGRLLDAGSGGDSLGEVLAQRGFDVVSLDLFSAPGMKDRFVRSDMNANLPFAGSVFDYVLLSESLQYLENHYKLLREFKRVLKPGGSAVVSMPNILSASSRLYFLKRGYYPHFKPVRTMDTEKGWDTVAYNVVSFVDIMEIMKRNGLELVALKASKIKSSGFFLYPVLKAVYTVGLLFEKNGYKADLLKRLSSREALLGDHLIIQMRRGREAAGGAGGREGRGGRV